MEKYYTPTIDEFGFGFEFEVKNSIDRLYIPEFKNDAWIKIKMGHSLGILSDFNNIQKLLVDCEIRVPYLTKEQIETEGWTYSNLAKRFFHTATGLTDDERACGLGIWISFDERGLMITDCRLSMHRVRFDGVIKNISEFRKLMKMLNIK